MASLMDGRTVPLRLEEKKPVAAEERIRCISMLYRLWVLQLPCAHSQFLFEFVHDSQIFSYLCVLAST
jgi:hypothetical protein